MASSKYQGLLAAALICLGFPVISEAQQRGVIVHLVIEPNRQTVDLGTQAIFTIRLLDSNRQPVLAPKDLTIVVEGKAGSGRTWQNKAVIRRGLSETRATQPMVETGLVKIRATHPETLEGGAVVYVRGKRQGTYMFRDNPYLSEGAFVLAAAWQPNQNPPDQTGPIDVILDVSGADGIQADGDTAAMIIACLKNTATTSSRAVTIILKEDKGTLSSQKLVIPKGESMGAVTLTSEQDGDVTISVLSSPDNIKLDKRSVQVHFISPVNDLTVELKPKDGISLLQTADVFVTLAGAKESGVHEPLLVNLLLETGYGVIEKEQVTIEKGHTFARAKLIPTRLGGVSVRAVTDKRLIPAISESIKVTIPVVLILCSALGGICGGALGYWWRKPSAWYIPSGGVLGFVAYWGVLYQVTPLVPLPLQHLAASVALNPISAVAISIVGGAVPPAWLGKSRSKSKGGSHPSGKVAPSHDSPIQT